MNTFLAIFFLIIGIAGLVFQNETGTFVGLTLFPWQMIKVTKDQVFNLPIIIVSAILGAVFFALIGEWLVLILFLFIQLYNYWGYLNIGRDEEEKN